MISQHASSFQIRSSLTLIGVAAGLSLAACTSTENSNSNIEGTLSAAGASFPAAIYQRWFSDLAPQGIRVNYQSVGSGAGVRQFTAGTVDFGASDKPMKPEAIDKVSRGVVQIPMTAGAIAVAYNNSDCELKLTQDQLSGIFLGSIKNYSELGCDPKAIKIVHRSDGSGTTYNFTKHLSAISPEWKTTSVLTNLSNGHLALEPKGPRLLGPPAVDGRVSFLVLTPKN